MKKILLPAVLLATAGVTGAAHAAFVDFATDPTATTGDTSVASITFDTITATAYYDPSNNGTNNWVSDVNNATLWRRDNVNDHGLGVCSTGESCPGDGNYNELSQLVVNEAIGLTKANATEKWTGLWVSSLDYSVTEEGGIDPESGTLWWGDGDADTVIGLGSSFVFSYFDLDTGVFEVNLFDLLTPDQKTAIGGAPNLYFTPTGGVGDDNDYLVWAAATEGGEFPSEVPVPAAVWLFGSGLLGLVGIARRRKM